MSSQAIKLHGSSRTSFISSTLVRYKSPNLQLISDKGIRENSKFVMQCGQSGITLSTGTREYSAKTIRNRKYLSKLEHGQFVVVDEIAEQIAKIKELIGSIEDGRISISPYDTAWVGLVRNIHQTKPTPLFPSCLEWIANNQFSDGSWGDAHFFSAYDRLLNTLACVVALRTWKIHHNKTQKGISFINNNIFMLEMESEEHMTIGFEVAFPSLIERARNLDIHISDDSPVIRDIFTKQQLKLAKIPKEILHSKHTTMLFSLEGLREEDLDWERLLKLQSPDGSFLTSPSATAFALMHTNNEKCFHFLKQVVERFNGGVPHCYPVDIFAGNWAVDRLQRLGISRYFQPEIKKFLSQVYRYWMESPERGLFSGRNTPFADLDDTAMVFRLLRLHGHNVSEDVFLNFKNGEDFQCFPLQTSESITAIFSLYRASQVRFPAEKLLEKAHAFSYRHLRKRQAKNKLHDKWAILKDLPGEVSYALDMPWYASLPRVEARFYIEQYGGSDEIWIGKTLNRMYEVSNDDYLVLAKLDFNKCQAHHQTEWNDIQKWYIKSNLSDNGVSRDDLLLAYFLAAASIFEPERSSERMSWAKSAILVEMIASYFNDEGTSEDQKRAFIHELSSNHTSINNSKSDSYTAGEQVSLVQKLVSTLRKLSVETIQRQGRDISRRLYNAWTTWLKNLSNGRVNNQGEAELLVLTTIHFGSNSVSDTTLINPHYKRLSALTDKVCHQLQIYANTKVGATDICNGDGGKIMLTQIEADMQELVELVLGNSDEIELNVREAFLTIAKSFFYRAYLSPDTIRMHISKVLFEQLI